MGTPRRASDNEGEDYSKARSGGPFNGHTKWIVGAVGTLMLTALVTLAGRDRATIDREQGIQNTRLDTIERLVGDLATNQAAQAASNGAFREEVLRSLGEIKADVKEVKREVAR